MRRLFARKWLLNFKIDLIFHRLGRLDPCRAWNYLMNVHVVSPVSPVSKAEDLELLKFCTTLIFTNIASTLMNCWVDGRTLNQDVHLFEGTQQMIFNLL